MMKAESSPLAEVRERDARFEGSGRWRQIVDVAGRLFSEKGYAATSMQEIADTVGMLKGSLYHYIGNKEDLLFHSILEVHTRMLERFDEYRTTPGTSLDRIRAFIEGHVELALEMFVEGPGPVFYTSFDALSEERQAIVLDLRRRFDDFLRELIDEGKDEGVIRKDVDPALSALAILTTLNSMYIWYDPSRSEDRETIAQQFADLYIRGLASPQGV